MLTPVGDQNAGKCGLDLRKKRPYRENRQEKSICGINSQYVRSSQHHSSFARTINSSPRCIYVELNPCGASHGQKNRAFLRVMAGRVRRFHSLTGRVGWGRKVFETSRVGSGRVGSGRVGSRDFQISRVGSGQSESGPTRPAKK